MIVPPEQLKKMIDACGAMRLAGGILPHDEWRIRKTAQRLAVRCEQYVVLEGDSFVARVDCGGAPGAMQFTRRAPAG